MRRARRLTLLVAVLAVAACDEPRPSAPHGAEGHRADVAGEGGHAHEGEAHGAGDWCAEHAIPESHCTKCNPSLIPKFQAAGDWCAGHGFPESKCPSCNPASPPPGAEVAAIEARVVRFRTPDLEGAVGIQTAAAAPGDQSSAIACTARIAFDADRVADVRALVPGIVRGIRAELGARVERGQTLFELESTQVSQIQGALHAAQERVRTERANLERQRDLREAGVTSARQVELAEQALAAAEAEAGTAKATLRMAGARGGQRTGRYALVAPLSGTIIRRPAVLGALATERASLATLADTSVMWALCDVPEAEAARVALGQAVVVQPEGAPGVRLEGALTWIAAEVDPRTRTVAARAEVPNPDGRLRAHQFARAWIETGRSVGAVTVPRAAVQRVLGREVVFVRTEPGVYAPRVVTRRGDGPRVAVDGPVRPGDAVVTTGAVLLRTEVMPGSIGAGCCEVGPAADEAGR